MIATLKYFLFGTRDEAARKRPTRVTRAKNVKALDDVTEMRLTANENKKKKRARKAKKNAFAEKLRRETIAAGIRTTQHEEEENVEPAQPPASPPAPRLKTPLPTPDPGASILTTEREELDNSYLVSEDEDVKEARSPRASPAEKEGEEDE